MLFVTLGCVDKFMNFNPMASYNNAFQQNAKPVIILEGANPLVLKKGEAYVEPGFSALGLSGQDLTSKVVGVHNIDINKVGEYFVRYNVSDNNVASVEMIRSVLVSESQTVTSVTYPNLENSPYEYMEYLPPGYQTNTEGTYPLVVFLHGIDDQGGVNLSTGERSGKALESVLGYGPLKLAKLGKTFPAIVVHPQSPEWWNPVKIKTYLDYLKTKYRVDSKKIYFTGLSMGGGGVWDFARAYPEEVAAIVPICGASSIANATQAAPLLSIPVWAFHARGDGTVPLSNSYSFLDFIYQGQTNKTERISSLYNSSVTTVKTAAIENKAIWMIYEGTNPGTSRDKMLTIYPHNSHDAWTATYNNQSVWNWLWSKSK